MALSSAAPRTAGAATTTGCTPTLPGAPGIAAGSVLTSSSPSYVTNELNGLQSLGTKWLRLDVAWSGVQPNGPSTYDWSHTDPPIQGAIARGINVDASLLYTPSWAAPPGAYDDHFPPTDPSLFAAFATAAVRRYAAMGVHTWEIWNEPNNPEFWRPAANVAQYATLLEQTYAAIKAVDPTATVLTGGTSPESTTSASLSPTDFLNGLYANGAGGSFDAVAHHPYTFPVMPGTTDSWSAWAQMSVTNPSLRSVMVAHGDGNKKIWMTEYGAPTDEVSEAQQSDEIAAAFQDASSYSWAGPLFIYSYQDLGTDNSNREDWFGLLRYDGSQKPSWGAYQTAVSAFDTACGGTGTGGTGGTGTGTGGTGTGTGGTTSDPSCTTYSSAATGSHQVCGAIRTKYEALGGPASFLGYPVTDETATPGGAGYFNDFANNGSIYWSSSTGAWSIHGAIRAKYLALGGPTSFLGYPITDETGTGDGVGRFNNFSSSSGSIYWSPSTGAWSIQGGIRAKYLALGGPTSFLRYPITDETGTPDGVGRFNHFSSSDGFGASIYWTPSTGAWSVHGAIRSKWASMGWERSCLRYPVSDEYAVHRGRRSNFQGGVVTYSFTTGQATSSC